MEAAQLENRRRQRTTRTSVVSTARRVRTEARRRKAPDKAEQNYHRFADWLCERHGIAEDEGKQVRTRLAGEIHTWLTEEKPRGVAKPDAFGHLVRRHMKQSNPRIVTVEAHRGGNSRSLYEVHGRRFGEQGFQVVAPAADGETMVGWDSDSFDGDDSQRVQALPQAKRGAVADGDLVLQVTSLLERAAQADEAEAKRELAVEMLEDASAQLVEVCDKIQRQIGRALAELR